MPTVYVYSPFTAQVFGLNCYCNGCCQNCGCNDCTHPPGFSTLGMCCPIDIGGSAYIAAGTAARFYGSAGIGSIRTIQMSGLCTSPNPGSPWDDAVMVELYRYDNAICYIGTLFYGHLSGRIPNAIYNNPNSQILGYVPACCPASCYGSVVHVHVGRDTSGQSRSLTCSSILYAGSTWFYSWYYNEGTC